jgi:hypothetical protein
MEVEKKRGKVEERERKNGMKGWKKGRWYCG